MGRHGANRTAREWVTNHAGSAQLDVGCWVLDVGCSTRSFPMKALLAMLALALIVTALAVFVRRPADLTQPVPVTADLTPAPRVEEDQAASVSASQTEDEREST